MNRILQAVILVFAAVLLFASWYLVLRADMEGKYLFAPNIIVANNVAGLMSSGCALACGLAILAVALHVRLSGSAALVSPAILLWVFLGVALILFASGFGIAFKDSPYMTSTTGGTVQAASSNNVDALAAFGLIVAGGVSLIAVAVLPRRMHATDG